MLLTNDTFLLHKKCVKSYPYQIEQYHQAYKKRIENPEEFWAEIAEHFTWQKKCDKVLDWNFLNQR